ncbi:MarR family winged helix-turn-helix transcriptional regulator [Niallia sp. 01092]|uniref:MarR family winged helix-turn-helix transcriptional regulator n=1 Tax=unclassified Niallia TaxID=2837522 RepID=UPI003FCEEE76
MEELAHQLLHSFRQFHKLKDMNQSFHGFKRSEIMMLFVIGCRNDQNEKAITISEISSILQITSPSVTQVINVLAKEGLVERINDQKDGRVVRITLTEKGKSVTKEIHQKIIEKYKQLVEYLGEEKSKELISLLTDVNEFFSKGKTCNDK